MARAGQGIGACVNAQCVETMRHTPSRRRYTPVAFQRRAFETDALEMGGVAALGYCAQTPRPVLAGRTPEKVARGVQSYIDVGADMTICQVQAGRIPHAKILESLRLFGEKVMPCFR